MHVLKEIIKLNKTELLNPIEPKIFLENLKPNKINIYVKLIKLINFNCFLTFKI
jgi:hypothetical protein